MRDKLNFRTAASERSLFIAAGTNKLTMTRYPDSWGEPLVGYLPRNCSRDWERPMELFPR